MSSTAKNPSTGRTGSCPYTLASPGMSPRKTRPGAPISFKSTPPLIIAQTRVSRRFQRFRPPFTRTLVNGDNNTLFFLMPVALVVGLSYLLLRLDLLVVQLAVMSLSFCGHYYLDNQYHVAGSWLGRFSGFRRKQQLHFIHHRHGNCNFAVIDFFWDRLLGTYRRAESGGCPVTS